MTDLQQFEKTREAKQQNVKVTFFVFSKKSFKERLKTKHF